MGSPSAGWRRRARSSTAGRRPGTRLLFGDLPLEPGPGGTGDRRIGPARGGRRAAVLGFRPQGAVPRPVPDAEEVRFLPIIRDALASGADFADAMHAGYSAVLCSPEFIGLAESPGQLDDHALAPAWRTSCGTRRRMTSCARLADLEGDFRDPDALRRRGRPPARRPEGPAVRGRLPRLLRLDLQEDR